MRILVNNVALQLHSGARVKDAIVAYYAQTGNKMPRQFPSVEDSYGNIVDSDGGLTDGNTLFIGATGKRRGSTLKAFIPLMAAIVFSCGTPRPTASTSADSRREAAKSVAVDRQAVIFAVNDMHAAIDEFPKLAWIVDSLRDVYPDMLLVSAGDNQSGNPVNDQYPMKGFPMIDLMNTTGFDLSAVGNHEFDTGQEGLSILTGKANFDFVCANLTPDIRFKYNIAPYKIFTLPNGLKLAFLGLLQLGLNGIPDSHPDNVKGFHFRSAFEVAPEYLWLKDSSDVLIALSHLGFEDDIKLAETMPKGIDLIIGGHSHTRVAKEQICNGILITQAETKLRYGTLIKLNVDSQGKVTVGMQLLSIRNIKKEDFSFRAMVDKYNDNPVLNQVIATATDDFSSSEQLGYLMADAQRAAAHADIALMNPGGVRISSIAKGPITIKNVYQLDPFGNELVVTKLTGKEILSLIRAAWSTDHKSPALLSGIRAEIKVNAQNDPEEIKIFEENGQSLDTNRIYTVAMNSYITQVYNYEHADPGQSLFFTTAEALIRYLKQAGEVRSYRGEHRVQVTKTSSL